MKSADLGKLTKFLRENKFVLLTLCLGLALLLIPRGKSTASAAAGAGDPLPVSGIPLDAESLRIAELLGQIRGVGETRVLLSAAGAVVVCEGADDPAVRLKVTNAVAAYTGLGSDKISVMKMK